ncbi:hypothetical protein LTR29_017807 [Friedmanniomyces endolithicus]|nr:hypothetical protein LTR29_017807 [Friedmanniomyces endolithicus]
MAHPHSSITLGDNHRGFQLGQNFGHVHVAPGALSLISPRRPCRANRDVLLERPETPPEPASQVPFRRDPHFVERARLTNQIRAKLFEPAGRAALVELGGVGHGVHCGGTMAAALTRVKEVTARDRLWQQSPQTWVLWIHASNVALRDVADQLKIYGRKDPKADLLQLLRNWLRDKSKERWLIVLDNANDAGFLLEPPATTGEAQPAQRRIDYSPTCDHGSVIITTRSKQEALRLVYESDMVDVLPMREGEAESCLKASWESWARMTAK